MDRRGQSDIFRGIGEIPWVCLFLQTNRSNDFLCYRPGLSGMKAKAGFLSHNLHGVDGWAN
jgi:hypothetical protein